MKIKSLFFRDRTETQINEVQVWQVRWTSRHGSYSADTKQEVRAFVSEKEAIEFADALKDAFRLIKHTSGNNVLIEKQV